MLLFNTPCHLTLSHFEYLIFALPIASCHASLFFFSFFDKVTKFKDRKKNRYDILKLIKLQLRA